MKRHYVIQTHQDRWSYRWPFKDMKVGDYFIFYGVNGRTGQQLVNSRAWNAGKRLGGLKFKTSSREGSIRCERIQ